MNQREYPDEPAGPFPAPPREFVDSEGRSIQIVGVDDHIDRERATRMLVEMYRAFDPADRAQGIPPTGESAVRDWVGRVMEEDCWNVIAISRERDTAVGHVTLVPDGEAYELAIFVLQSHQGAGIGTELLRTALGYGARHDVDRVWLTVERWNAAAIALYRKVGFVTDESGSFELEMCLRLGDDYTESTG
ncbi:MAG: GNAT family N-acetyltransferase [Haloferacaceae archaeon]|jgi:ribosomal protein S18 acetylase RimI-like enzyme